MRWENCLFVHRRESFIFAVYCLAFLAFNYGTFSWIVIAFPSLAEERLTDILYKLNYLLFNWLLTNWLPLLTMAITVMMAISLQRMQLLHHRLVESSSPIQDKRVQEKRVQVIKSWQHRQYTWHCNLRLSLNWNFNCKVNIITLWNCNYQPWCWMIMLVSVCCCVTWSLVEVISRWSIISLMISWSRSKQDDKHSKLSNWKLHVERQTDKLFESLSRMFESIIVIWETSFATTDNTCDIIALMSNSWDKESTSSYIIIIMRSC